MNAVLNKLLRTIFYFNQLELYLHRNSKKTAFAEQRLIVHGSPCYIFFCHFTTLSRSWVKNTLLKLINTQMLRYLIPFRMICHKVHNFTSNKLLAVFYIGGNTAQKKSFPLRISSVNVTNPQARIPSIYMAKSTGNCRFSHIY